MAAAAEHHRRFAAKRKAERHAAKATIPRPRCRQCDAVIADVHRLASPVSLGARLLQQCLPTRGVA